MLGVAREAWEAAGYEVRGVALSGIAAENLESGTGISSRTIASMEHGWEQGRDLLTSRDVLVIDEAGMVGTRQLERVLSHAAEASAKVVLVGDPAQLQAIEAGAAFRSIHGRHGGAEIGDIRRQREDWQRDATRDLATGRTGEALEAYRSHGMVHEAQTREQARGNLIERWDRDRQSSPERAGSSSSTPTTRCAPSMRPRGSGCGLQATSAMRCGSRSSAASATSPAGTASCSCRMNAGSA